MADLTAVCNSVGTTLATISGLRVSNQFVSQVNPPAAVVMPQPGQALRFDTLDGGITYFLRVVLLVSMTEDTSSVALLNSYLATTGASSVAQTLRLAPRAAGVYDYAIMDSVRGYGMMEWAGQQYLGAQILVQAMAS